MCDYRLALNYYFLFEYRFDWIGFIPRFGIILTLCSNSNKAQFYVFSIRKESCNNICMCVINSTDLLIGLRNTGSAQCTCDRSSVTECSECRSRWRWIDGSDVSINNWLGHEPQYAEACGRVVREGRWAARDCGARYRFLCQIRE